MERRRISVPISKVKRRRGDKPIPRDAYHTLDTDLARDNIENDLPAADREDLGGEHMYPHPDTWEP